MIRQIMALDGRLSSWAGVFLSLWVSLIKLYYVKTKDRFVAR
jgi:hypothetical protein